MKFFTICFALCMSSLAFAQETIKSKASIDSMLIGTWKLKGSEYNSRFEFTSSNGKLMCNVYQFLEKENNSTDITHHTQVSIIEKDSVYELKWDYPLFYWTGTLDQLKSRQLLVEINGNQLKFVKENP